MSEHTPGPWECIPKINASENHKGFFVRAKKVTNDGKWSLAEVHPGDVGQAYRVVETPGHREAGGIVTRPKGVVLMRKFPVTHLKRLGPEMIVDHFASRP